METLTATPQTVSHCSLRLQGTWCVRPAWVLDFPLGMDVSPLVISYVCKLEFVFILVVFFFQDLKAADMLI